MKLTKKDLRDLAKREKTIKEGDLYQALHCVRDDPVKSEIEEVLRQVLDDASFRKVVAVFKMVTT